MGAPGAGGRLEIRLVFPSPVEMRRPDRSRLTLVAGGREIVLPEVSAEQEKLWKDLARTGSTRQGLDARLAALPEPQRPRVELQIELLVQTGQLLWSLHDGDTRLLSRRQLSPRFRETPVDPAAIYELSRFAYLRRRDGELVLESPLSHARVTIHDASVPAALMPPPGGIGTRQSGSPLRRAVHDFLAQSGMMTAIDPGSAGPEAAEERDTVLRQWQFHDLLFHSRSRPGRHGGAVGGTARFAGRIEPLPPRKAPMSGDPMRLPRPDLESLETTDPPLTRVLERRRSLRGGRSAPLTVAEVGEFLYRSAHVQKSDPARGVSWRPTPGAGGVHELELYLAVGRCDGLSEDLYHYDPQEHSLERLPGVDRRRLEELLEGAAAALGTGVRPGVLILLAARFQRVSWKYSGVAYALILKDVGALFQTMYLVATAMGLAPCALGASDSDLFSDATGLRYEEEGTVGEFALW